MRFVLLEHLKENDKIAKNIYNTKGIMLAKAGSIISAKLLEILKHMNIYGLYILDEETKDLVIEEIIPDSVKSRAIYAMLEKNWEDVIEIAKSFVNILKDIKIDKINFIDAKTNSHYIEKHAISMCVYSIILGKTLGMTEEQLENLAIISLLSYYGLTQIPKEIVEKPIEDLSKDEIRIIKNYPRINFEYFSHDKYLPINSLIRNGLLTIGENIDGQGFFSISGDKLTIYSKIMHIVDCYDCLISPRPNVEAKSIPDAMEYIMARNGTYFDPEIVSVFTSIFPVYPNGISLQLSNGEIAVVYSSEHNSLRPIVKILGKDYLVDLFDNENYRSVTILSIY